MEQPELIWIDTTLRLRKIRLEDYETALAWYQDPEVLKGVADPNRTEPYDRELVKRMYQYLSNIGECYIIEIARNSEWFSIGDITLSPTTLPIVIGDKTYWGRGIGKKLIMALLDRARQLGYSKISLKEIFNDNHRSIRLYTSCGFKPVGTTERGVSLEINLTT